MHTEKLQLRSILKQSKQAVLDDKSGAFAVTYSFVISVIICFGIYFIHSSLIFFLSDIFPKEIPGKVNGMNSVRLFSVLVSVIILSPVFISVLAKGYFLAKGKRVRSPSISYFRSVYLYSGMLLRVLTVFFSLKFLFSYSGLADLFCEHTDFSRDTVIAVSVLVFSLFSAVSVYSTARFILLIFLFIKNPDTKYTAAIKTVREQFRGHFHEFVLLNIRFIPMLFGAVFSMGILLIYIIPHYTVSLSLLCDRILCDSKIKVKNYKITYRLTEVNAK